MLQPFVNRTTKWLAELSYGVYLIHWLLIIYLYEFSGLPSNGTLADLALWTAIVLPPSLLFAALSRRWFELPIQRWVLRRTAAPPPIGGSSRRPAAPVRPSGANRLWPPARIDAPAGDRPDRRRAVADLIDFRAGERGRAYRSAGGAGGAWLRDGERS